MSEYAKCLANGRCPKCRFKTNECQCRSDIQAWEAKVYAVMLVIIIALFIVLYELEGFSWTEPGINWEYFNDR